MQNEVREKINSYGANREPFFFLCDFELQKPLVLELDKLEKEGIRYEFNATKKPTKEYSFRKNPIEFKEYKKALEAVQEEIKSGNVYILNLCFKTSLDTNLSLEDIYENSEALFKLYKRDDFVCFTPEMFVNIENQKITTYPMKGTIDAKLKEAEKKLLEDKKEFAEHVMVTDLLRNDLGIVAKNIKVDEFRYIQKVATKEGELLQCSSKISGELDSLWHERLGDILSHLLPAGSVSGTPKKSARSIIRDIEKEDRGYFTGVAGVYDGESFQSFVLIRYIQKDGDRLFFRSGGGVTIDSSAKKEYEELKDKVYVTF